MEAGLAQTQLEKYLAPGSLFDNKYRIERLLGSGSFAVVVKARHEVMERDVALKFLKPDVVAAHPEVAERFVREVRIVSKLAHPSTIMTYDFGRTPDGLLYMVLEYVNGRTLDDALASSGPWSAVRSLEACEQILGSLDEAHAQGIVHRDLKPANIMVGKGAAGEVVKVLDFGVAKLLEMSDRRVTTRSGRSTQFIGTPIYMSPEQIMGQGVGPATDYYSLGLILYELLTGEVAVDGENVANIARQHLDERPLEFRAMARVPAVIRPIIYTATRRHVHQRYASGAEFRAALLDARAALRSADLRAPAPAAKPAARPASATPPGAAASRPARRAASSAPEGAATRLMDNDDDGLFDDVFSGRHYIEAPSIDEEELFGNTYERVRPAPRPTSAPRQSQSQSPRKPMGSLELDTAALERTPPTSRVSSVDASGTRPAVIIDRRVRQREARWFSATIAALLLAGAYAAFVLVSAPLQAFAPAMRAAAGLLPVGLAALWVGFATVGVDHQSFTRRWLLPTTHRVWGIVLATMLLYALFASRYAAQGLANEGTWFFEALPAHAVVDSLERVTASAAASLSSLFAAIGRMLPW